MKYCLFLEYIVNFSNAKLLNSNKKICLVVFSGKRTFYLNNKNHVGELKSHFSRNPIFLNFFFFF